MPWIITQLIHVSCGIEGLDTFTIQLFQAYKIWLQVCHVPSPLLVEREAFTRLLKIPLMLCYIIQLIHVSYGIEDLDTFTTQLSQACRRWSQVC